MDELDKKVAPEEGAELCAPEGAAISETCVENESPAEALSEATDELQPSSQEEEPQRNVHSMSKE